MKNYIFCFFISSLPLLSIAQLKNKTDEATEIALFSKLIGELYKEKIQVDDWSRSTRQHLFLDEESMKIVYRTKPFNENENDKKPEVINWGPTYRIPVYEIDTILENGKNKTIEIIMKDSRGSIAVYQPIPGGQHAPAAYIETISIHAKIGETQNLINRLNSHVKNLQHYKRKKISSDAREIVKEALLEHLHTKEYKSQDVEKMQDDPTLYIPKCRICDGTKNALFSYIHANKRDDQKWILFSFINGSSGSHEDKMSALHDLVSEAVEQYYSHYDAKQVEQMRKILTAERKKSMSLADGKKCASCDGACAKPE